MTKAIELKDCRSYASKVNLERGLKKLGLDEYSHVVCKTEEDKWTAVFSFNLARVENDEAYLGFASAHGFMTLA